MYVGWNVLVNRHLSVLRTLFLGENLLNAYPSCDAVSCRCRGVRLCRVEHPLWCCGAASGGSRVESSRVVGIGGGLDRGDDHDDEDDQIVFFWPDGAGCVWGVATEWINAVCAGEAVGSVDWYDRMGWI